jgi:hypothetical protein
MQAIVTGDREAGAAGLSLAEVSYPRAAENDVVVQVYPASFTPQELEWPGTWTGLGVQRHARRIRRGRGRNVALLSADLIDMDAVPTQPERASRS